MKKIYIIISSSVKHLGLFDDITGCENAVVVPAITLKPVTSIFQRLYRKINFSCNFNKFKWFCYNDILYKDDIGSVLILDTAMVEMDLNFLFQLRKKNVLVNLFFINSKHKLPNRTNYTDTYFVGSIKGGRGQLINDVYKYLSSNGVRCRFDVRSKNVDYLTDGMNHIQGKWIPYTDVLQAIADTDCIIEIMQENQSGATLRYFEAIVYNKKLLSNNPHIVEFPFYDKRWMRTFKRVEEIDLEWLNNKVDVNYFYNNEFSPINLIQSIKQ